MKVEKTLISKLLIYYSLKGNTKGIVDSVEWSDFDVVDINKIKEINLNKYDVIVIGTSTYGRGVPPKPFWSLIDQFRNLNGKRVGLFGSGRREYEYFCGALDLLEEIISEKNKVLFKYKFEGYPREIDITKFKEIIRSVY